MCVIPIIAFPTSQRVQKDSVLEVVSVTCFVSTPAHNLLPNDLLTSLWARARHKGNQAMN